MSLTVNTQINSNTIPFTENAKTALTESAQRVQEVYIGIIALQIHFVDSIISWTKETVIAVAEGVKHFVLSAIGFQIRTSEALLSLIIPLNNRSITDITDQSSVPVVSVPSASIMPRLREREQDEFTSYVEDRNTDRLAEARAHSVMGAEFIYDLIKGKPELKEEIESCDPEIFVKVPQLAVESVVTREAAPTRENTPAFMHGHLSDLARLHAENLLDGTISGECKAIASKMHQGNVAFNAAMESAFQKASA